MPVCPICGGAKRAWHLYDAADDADDGNANLSNGFYSFTVTARRYSLSCSPRDRHKHAVYQNMITAMAAVTRLVQ
jgi:hypothetical protein